MRKARAEVVAGAVKKNLRLILQPAKRARMNDASPVALKFSTIGMAGSDVGALSILPISARQRPALCARPPAFLCALPLCAHSSGV